MVPMDLNIEIGDEEDRDRDAIDGRYPWGVVDFHDGFRAGGSARDD
jgi:hypothetical protein